MVWAAIAVLTVAVATSGALSLLAYLESRVPEEPPTVVMAVEVDDPVLAMYRLHYAEEWETIWALEDLIEKQGGLLNMSFTWLVELVGENRALGGGE